MKNTVALVALAATLGEVSATFRLAKPFSCPDTINNSCEEKQKAGFDFGDLVPGSFDKYNDFNFKGWTCESKSSKKVIKGECGPTVEESPSFGHPENPFSVDYLDVTPEEDTDLEFHYDMPDGSKCKQRSSCSKYGSTVKNSQCGGAKKVTITYPSNNRSPKSKCKVDVGKIGFGCDKTKYPPPPVVVPPPPVPTPSTLSTVFSTAPATTSSPAEVETGYVPPVEETKPVESAPAPSVPGVSIPFPSIPAISIPFPSIPAISIPFPSIPVPSLPAISIPVPSIPGVSIPVPSIPGVSYPAPSAPAPSAPSAPAESAPAESTTSAEIPVVSKPASSAPASSAPAESTTSAEIPVVSKPAESAPAESAPVESAPVYSAPGESVPASVPVQSTTSAEIPVISKPPVVETTVFESTSTIFTTSIATITDCGPEKPECGGAETPVTVVVTVPLTTTVCPVTETYTRPATIETPVAEKPEQPESPATPETPETPEEPETELPFDEVVPRCLVTWLPLVPDCKDNTDAKCFCPSKEFVENVFKCIYAYGESDEIVDKALKFVQGICAEQVPENPAVVTGVDSITEILIIPTATAPVPGIYTTITLDTTVTVPCVEDGTTISASSTTSVIKATIEVPKVDFATTASDIYPVVPTAIPVELPEEGETEGNSPTLIVAPSSPIGTGGLPVPTGSGDIPAEAGAGKLSAGLTAVAAVILAMAAL